MAKENFQEICRVCMCKSKSNTLLNEICIAKSLPVNYLDAFNECTKLKAALLDNLPQSICSRCCSALEISYEFLLTAKDSDAQLRQRNLSENRKKLGLQEILANDTHVSNRIKSEGEFHLSEVNMCAADPLENSADEYEYNDQLHSTIENHFSDHVQYAISSDDEDDKPLKDLIDAATRERNITFAIETNRADSISSLEVVDEKIDELLPSVVDSNCDIDAPDVALTAEAQLFPQGRFKCDQCENAYFTLIGLETHAEIHFPKKATVHRKRSRSSNKICSNANKTHMDTVLKMEKEKQDTEIVAESNATPETLRKLRKTKPPKPKKVFPCQACGKHMISASKLRYHMVMHTGEKDYLCTICPKAYSTIYALKHHMNTHIGHRPYECKFCGDKFTRPTTLKSHMRRHTGERPYGCDICGKRFIQHSSMTTHMKLNHMDKTIPCPHCDKKYARQTDLNTHLLSHTGNKPFSCQQCPSRFIRQANLNKHTNQHHANRTNEMCKLTIKSKDAEELCSNALPH